VKLDSAGKTLVISRSQQGGVQREGTLEVYQDLDDGSDDFVHATTIPTPVFDDPQWGWCRNPALSDAGHIARVCFTGANLEHYTQVFKATSWAPLQYTESARLPGSGNHDLAIDAKGTRLAVLNSGNVDGGIRTWLTVFRCENGDWIEEARLSPFKNPNGDFAFAGLADISGDGKLIAIANSGDTLMGRGPLFPPYQTNPSSSAGNGTVAVYDLRPTGWRLRRYVKPDTDNVHRGFGWDVALNHNGHVMAVGSPYDDTSTTGIDGAREDESPTVDSGAIWLY